MEKLAFNLSIFLTVVAVLILAGAASSKLAAIISRCSQRVSTAPLHTAKPLSYILSRVASWINVPVLVMFLGVGMLAGSEGFGGIRYDDPFSANIIGTVAMAFILYSGGYDTSWKSVKSVIGYGSILSSVGVLLTAAAVGFGTYGFFRLLGMDYPLSWCLLLGSIVSSTDAAAVFAILRSKSVSLKGKLQPLLEYESGSNDPMATFLTLFMIDVITRPEVTSYWSILWTFPLRMGIGILLGIVIGKLATKFFNIIDFDYDGLYYVVGIGVVLLAYGASDWGFGTEYLRGNGFMAAYVCGMVMGNSKFTYQHGLGRFHDGIGWLMQVTLFGMLGLLVSPHGLLKALWFGLGISLIMMFVARPLVVFLCMIGSKFTMKERTFVSWVGLRGGAPIMLATFPLMYKVENSAMMFNIVFLIVLTSVVLQGKTLMPFAKLLGLDKPLKVSPRVPLEFENTGTMSGDMREFEILPGSPLIDKKLSQLGLPKGALVLLIRRGDNFVVPHGSTLVHEADGLMVLAEPEVLDETVKVLGQEEPEE